MRNQASKAIATDLTVRDAEESGPLAATRPRATAPRATAVRAGDPEGGVLLRVDGRGRAERSGKATGITAEEAVLLGDYNLHNG